MVMEYITMWLVAADIAFTLFVMAGVREIIKKLERGAEHERTSGCKGCGKAD